MEQYTLPTNLVTNVQQVQFSPKSGNNGWDDPVCTIKDI